VCRVDGSEFRWGKCVGLMVQSSGGVSVLMVWRSPDVLAVATDPKRVSVSRVAMNLVGAFVCVDPYASCVEGLRMRISGFGSRVYGFVRRV